MTSLDNCQDTDAVFTYRQLDLQIPERRIDSRAGLCIFTLCFFRMTEWSMNHFDGVMEEVQKKKNNAAIVHTLPPSGMGVLECVHFVLVCMCLYQCVWVCLFV